MNHVVCCTVGQHITQTGSTPNQVTKFGLRHLVAVNCPDGSWKRLNVHALFGRLKDHCSITQRFVALLRVWNYCNIFVYVSSLHLQLLSFRSIKLIANASDYWQSTEQILNKMDEAICCKSMRDEYRSSKLIFAFVVYRILKISFKATKFSCGVKRDCQF